MTNGIIKKCRILKHCCELGSITFQSKISNVRSIDFYRSRTWLVEPCEELSQSGFPRSCMPNEGNFLSFFNCKRDILEDFSIVGWIREREMIIAERILKFCEYFCSIIWLIFHIENNANFCKISEMPNNISVGIFQCLKWCINTSCKSYKEKKISERHLSMKYKKNSSNRYTHFPHKFKDFSSSIQKTPNLSNMKLFIPSIINNCFYDFCLTFFPCIKFRNTNVCKTISESTKNFIPKIIGSLLKYMYFFSYSHRNNNPYGHNRK